MSFGTLINPSHCHSTYNPLNKLSQHIQTDYSLRKELWNNNEESTKIKNTSFRSKNIEKSTTDNISSSQVLAEEFHQYQQHNNPNYFFFSPKKSFPFHQNHDNQLTDTILSTSWHSSTSTPSSSINKYNDKVHTLLTEFEKFEQPSSSTSSSSIPRQKIPLYNQYHHHQNYHLPSRTNIKPMNMYNNNVNKSINMENSLQEDWEKAFRSFDHHQKAVTTIDHTLTTKNEIKQSDTIQIDYMGSIDENKYQDDLLEQQQEKENRASTNHTTETLNALQWKNLGMTLQENNDDKSAILAFNNAVNIDTSLTDAWLGLAISYANEHNRGKVYDCLLSWLLNNQHYQSIIKHDPLFLKKESKDGGDLLMKKAQDNHDYEEQLLYKKHQHLVELYLKVARSTPGHNDIDNITDNNKEITIDTDVQVILGLLFYLSKEEKKMMDMEKAMDCFETALSYKSDDYRVWNQLGAIFAQQPHQHHQAIEMYQCALQLNKSFIRARYNLAILLMKMGLYEQAAHHLIVALMDQQTSIMEINDIYKSSFDSTEIWSSLRLVMYMLNLDHLAEACNLKDLSQFDYFIHMEN